MRAGLAILIAPQILGGVADYSSIQTAYGVITVPLLVAFGVIVWTNHAVARKA